MKVTVVDPNVGYSPLPNIGLGYLISSIKNRHSVNLLDLTFAWKNFGVYFENAIRDQMPDVIGFSVSSFSFPLGLKLARAAKEIYPGIHVVFGGVHPTIAPEEVIQYPFVDSVCIGEGEFSFPEFLDTLERGRQPRIAGFWAKDKNGEVIRNPLRPFEPDLDKIAPPSWEYWDMRRYIRANSVYTGTGGFVLITSRGCFYDCNFCSVHMIRKSVPGTYYRVRSARNIIDEIKKNIRIYWDQGLRGIDIHDGYFGGNWEQFQRFCYLYQKEGLHKVVPWACMTRADVITERWARLAAESGCMKVNIGIETADEDLRNTLYKKQLSNKKIQEAIGNLEKHGIHYLFLMIIGCPEEKRETIRQNIRFIKRYHPIEVRMPFVQPHPKTDYAKMIGKVVDDTDKEFTFLKGDDVCRAPSKYLSIGELNRAITHFRMWWVTRWLKNDFLKFGLRFITDLTVYFLNIGGVRPIPLGHPYTYKVIKARTHLKYYFDIWKRKHGVISPASSKDTVMRLLEPDREVKT